MNMDEFFGVPSRQSLLDPDDKLFTKEDLETHRFKIHELETSPGSGILAIRSDKPIIDMKDEGSWLDFGVFSWHSKGMFEDERIDAYSLWWKGCGPGGENCSLRELRHSYFGNSGDGYVFYFSLNEMTAAIKLLRRWFDGN